MPALVLRKTPVGGNCAVREQLDKSRRLCVQSFAHIERFIIADALPAEIRETQADIKLMCPVIAGRHSEMYARSPFARNRSINWFIIRVP